MMSRGEGKDSHGPTGGVKGGPTGLGRGDHSRRGVDASDHSGWSSENNPWGGSHGGGGSGQGNGGGHSGGGSSSGVNLSLFPEAQASIALGAPSTLSLFDNLWGFALLK